MTTDAAEHDDPAGAAPAASGAPDADTADAGDDAAYLDRVRREIEEEVRRRRAAGDFPPSFERRLDELFARYTPTGDADDYFTEALKLADRAAFFDINVPVGSRREPRGFVKWSLWQAEAWFVRYVVDQLNHFSASAMRVLHLLDERLADVERDVALVTGPEMADGDELTPGADPGPHAAAVVGRIAAAAAGRRVLHAECGDGTLLRALAGAGVDAYGIDPGTVAADAAAAAGLDCRRDDVLGHLGSLPDGALGGLVLSGVVDRVTTAHRRRLVALAELKLAPGAVLAVIGCTAAAWERVAGPVASDLAPGRPWHPETWADLATRAGLDGTEIHRVEDSFAVLAAKRPAP